MEIEGDIEEDCVYYDGAEGVADDEGTAGIVGYEGEGHDGLGGVVFSYDEQGETNDSEDYTGENERVCPGVDITTEVLMSIRLSCPHV